MQDLVLQKMNIVKLFIFHILEARPYNDAIQGYSPFRDIERYSPFMYYAPQYYEKRGKFAKIWHFY